MSFQQRGEAVVAALDLGELKQVFRALHRQLATTPELMETQFLTELQRFLHVTAQQQGVDIADHAAWDRWLEHSATPSSGRRPG